MNEVLSYSTNQVNVSVIVSLMIKRNRITKYPSELMIIISNFLIFRYLIVLAAKNKDAPKFPNEGSSFRNGTGKF